MALTTALNEALLPIYLLLLSCFISPIFGSVTSLYITSSLSTIASALMIYVSATFLTSGGLNIWLQPLVRFSQPFSGILNLGIDMLSAFFILVLGIISLASTIYGISYIKRYSGFDSLRSYSTSYPLFLLSMYLVLISNDVILFIISWELMSVAAFFLISFERANEVARRAALKYILMSYLGSGLLIMALILTYVISGSTSFAALRSLSLEPITQYSIITLLLIGFGIKAALVPMHSWLPDAHPEAPSNISALLSGFMIKTAVYGIVRFSILLLSLNYYVLGLILASLGLMSAAYGNLMALIQTDSKRLMAYSSIAQIGYIFLGIGGGLTLHPNYLGFIALTAGLFHTLNHAIFKGLLFLTAGSLIYRTGSRDLNVLGGLAKVMPVTYASGLIGSLAISGIPPLNGFVSKWLIILSLLISGHPILILYAAIAIFVSALTLASFFKYISRAFISNPSNITLGEVREVPLPMVLAEILLASLCLLLGIFFYIPFNVIASVVNNVVTYDVSRANIIMSEVISALQIFALIVIGILISSLITTYLIRKRRVKLTSLWTFGTKELLPERLGLYAHSYYTEFEDTYSLSYELRYLIYRLIIDPLTKYFMRLVKTYDIVDTYLYTALVTVSIFLAVVVALAFILII